MIGGRRGWFGESYRHSLASRGYFSKKSGLLSADRYSQIEIDRENEEKERQNEIDRENEEKNRLDRYSKVQRQRKDAFDVAMDLYNRDDFSGDPAEVMSSEAENRLKSKGYSKSEIEEVRGVLYDLVVNEGEYSGEEYGSDKSVPYELYAFEREKEQKEKKKIEKLKGEFSKSGIEVEEDW